MEITKLMENKKERYTLKAVHHRLYRPELVAMIYIAYHLRNQVTKLVHVV